MRVFGLSPAASSPAMASPVTGRSGLALSLSLSLWAKSGFGVQGGRASEGDEGQRKGAGYEPKGLSNQKKKSYGRRNELSWPNCEVFGRQKYILWPIL